jgi:endonuclease-3
MLVLKKLKEIIDVAQGIIPEPMSVRIAREYGSDPFLILISCLLSLRSRDTVTYGVCKKLFSRVQTPAQFLSFPTKDLESIIYPIGFYHKKAQTLKEVSEAVLTRFDGKVPNTLEDLLSLPGVGRKTANLVLAEAYGVPALVVDTHVHRLANLLGLVSTKTPEQTERALEKIIPRDRWIETHRMLVMCGQNPKKCDISGLMGFKK